MSIKNMGTPDRKQEKVRRDDPLAETTTTNLAEGESGPTPDPASMVTVDIPMPDDYLHELSQTFALFGRRCSSEENDLHLEQNTGPRNKKRRAGAGCIDDSGGSEEWYQSGDSGSDGLSARSKPIPSNRATKKMAAAGETQGRKQSRAASTKKHAATSFQKVQDILVKFLERRDPMDAHMAALTVSLYEYLKNEDDRETKRHALNQTQVARRRAQAAQRLATSQREHDIMALKGRIELCQDLDMAK